MKYINLFDTQAEYDAAEKYYPNVSYIEATDEVVYQEISPEPHSDIIVAKFTTTSANQNVSITYNQALFSDISIDGVDQTIGTGTLNHTFASAGEHIVEYKALDTTLIPIDAFYSCTGLTSVTIPDSVTSIGAAAFNECTGLTSVTIGNSVESIGDGAFNECTGLTSVTIGNSVTTIGNYAFYSCTGLTSVTIGDSVTTIGNEAFSSCSGLTSVTIPNSVTTIGDGAFNECTGLTSITSLATTPPTIQFSTFEGVPYDCPIYVPAESVFEYQDAEGWRDRADYIQPIQ